MTSPTAHLPWEIIDYILSFLRNDPPSLQACAKVNQDFHDLADRHFYHQITLHNFPPSDAYHTAAQLLQTLHTKPHIASYVKSLRIFITNPGMWKRFRVRSMKAEELAPVLALLPQLTALSINGMRDGKINWHKLHSSFHNALFDLVSSPHLSSITINEIDAFPLLCLLRSPSLKHLSITGVMDTRSEYTSRLVENFGLTKVASDIVCYPTGPRLRSMYVGPQTFPLPDRQPDLIGQKHHFLDMSELKSLTVAQQFPADMDRMAAILQLCSDNLRSLYFHTGIELHTIYDLNSNTTVANTVRPLNMAHLISLRSLAIVTNIISENRHWVSSDGQESVSTNTYSTAFPWIVQTLETLQTPLTLEHLVLRCVFMTSQLSMERINWSGLAQILSSQPFKRLRACEMRVAFDRGCVNPDLGVEILRRDKHLGPLVKNGSLSISKWKVECPS